MGASRLVGTGELLEDADDATSILDLLSEMVNQYRISDHVITYCNASWAAQDGVERHDFDRILEIADEDTRDQILRLVRCG